MTCSITWEMCSTSSRVPWKALLAVTAASTSQIGRMPRSRAASADSTTSAAAPDAEDHAVPAVVERQGGVLDHLVGGCRAAGEESRTGPGQEVSEEMSSAETTTTRRQRPALIQSSATHSAWAVLAQAAFT